MLMMDEINKIRKSFFTLGLTRAAIAKKYNRSWDTVNRLVNMERDELENRGKRPSRSRQVMTEEVIEAIKKYLDEEEEKCVKKKQKYTGLQIFRELTEKKIYSGSRRRMHEVISVLRQERGQSRKPTFLPLEFPAGSALQIDHGEADVEIDGVRVKGYLFVASVPGQVLRYCQIFPTKASEAWGEFHERAFNFFGGAFPRVIYDNDTVLVKRIIGKERKQTSFSLSLEEHYGFESHFCNLAAGNEKGAVENGVGYCRRRFLAGYPTFESFEGANDLLASCCQKDIENGVHYKTQENLGELFRETQEKLTPLPLRKKWCRWTPCRVDQCQLINIDHHQYSVPEKFVGCSMRVAVTIGEIEVFDGKDQVATHKRQYGKKDVLQIDHYLDQLLKKPAAFSYAKVVKQNNFHPKLQEMWSRLSEKYGNKEANRQFVSILLLRRQWTQEDLIVGVEKALEWGSVDYAAVDHIIRQNQMPGSASDDTAQLVPTRETSWGFDLSPYAELCMGETL
jgi:transposase